jgi:hypothetical protein
MWTHSQTLTTFPAIREAIKGVVLVENSEKMRAVQSEKLGKQCEQAGIALSWHDKVDDVEPCTWLKISTSSLLTLSRGLHHVHRP